jgi:hypothetical protein
MQVTIKSDALRQLLKHPTLPAHFYVGGKQWERFRDENFYVGHWWAL